MSDIYKGVATSKSGIFGEPVNISLKNPRRQSDILKEIAQKEASSNDDDTYDIGVTTAYIPQIPKILTVESLIRFYESTGSLTVNGAFSGVALATANFLKEYLTLKQLEKKLEAMEVEEVEEE